MILKGTITNIRNDTTQFVEFIKKNSQFMSDSSFSLTSLKALRVGSAMFKRLPERPVQFLRKHSFGKRENTVVTDDPVTVGTSRDKKKEEDTSIGLSDMEKLQGHLVKLNVRHTLLAKNYNSRRLSF